MTQEALKLALEALENAEYGDYDKKELNEAITAIKEALREHAMREVQRLGQEIEQEPVALESLLGAIARGWCHEKNASKEMDSDLAMAIATEVKTLYATPPQLEERNFCQRCGKRTKDIHTCTPPQRTWVGLTESERRLINFQWQDGNGTAPEIIDLVEAKLKQKNGYAEEKNNA
jgi:hypothetical protein